MRDLPKWFKYFSHSYALPNIDKFRKVAIDSDILATLIDLLEFDKQGLSGGPRGLMKLADYGSHLKPSKKTLLAG
jgi:hypothetical protein